jgi:hypothetical protein
MPTHEIKQGECISTLAYIYGFADWKAIWDHADNAELKKKRKNPNILLPGDKVAIPERKIKKFDCQAGKVHKFKIKSAITKLRLALKDDEGRNLARKKTRLKAGGIEIEGYTSPEGVLEMNVPADIYEATLSAWLEEDDESPDFEWLLALGHLDPLPEISGIQARLNNLGYDSGAVTGEMNDATRAALKAFQLANEKEPTGEADSDTLKVLEKAHDNAGQDGDKGENRK